MTGEIAATTADSDAKLEEYAKRLEECRVIIEEKEQELMKVLMGKAMKELRGRVDGEKVYSRLKKIVHEQFVDGLIKELELRKEGRKEE